MAILETFGSNPSGEALKKIKASPQFRDGSFHNLSATPNLIKGASAGKIFWRYLNKPASTTPRKRLPTIKNGLNDLPGEASIVWFGHSSYLVHILGKNILVDPVFSGHASPFSFAGRCFPGTNEFSVDDLPQIDILLLTHDHYDHLDHSTVLKLRSKVKAIYTSLGVGSHLRHWGFEPARVYEMDWWESQQYDSQLRLTATPARHFSGRTFRQNRTLWSSFVLEAGNYRLYLGADSGYDTHFREIGSRFGPFDLALLECGQYNEWWPYIHMLPEQTVQAAIDLGAQWLLPVHWAKFALAMHPWYEPADRVVAKARELKLPITTPRIGETVILGKHYPQDDWWRDFV
jgi:L-ascorbate metabolism protein UlaG (beta-lactamase superfamily)